MRGPEAEEPELWAFLDHYLDDRIEGRSRSLEEYLALYPDHEGPVAREYERLQKVEAAAAGAKVPISALDAPAEKIGPYELLHEIGRGGQGVVYLAQDTRLPRKVALKVLHTTSALTSLESGSKGTMARFRREAELASRLEHPGICSVYEAGVAQGVPYIAMQLVPGETLAQRVARTQASTGAGGDFGPIGSGERSVSTTQSEDRKNSTDARATSTCIDRSEVARIVATFEKSARALHAAHELGVIHRDIKPGNIMLSPDGQPVILDFGLAGSDEAATEQLTQTGDLFGTPAYMSPEQLTRGSIRLDRRTDVYSLGATLYECLTLQRPFRAPTREALYHVILTEEPGDPRKLNSSIPSELRVVLAMAMEKNRDRRYQTALDLAEELRRVREHEPILAKPVGPWGRTARWVQRHPGVAASLTLAFLILVAGTVVSTTLGIKATRARRESESKNASVFRLRAFETLADLRKRAEEDGWPLAPERASALGSRIKLNEAWIDDARKTVAGLREPDPETGAQGHYAQRDELQRRALPQTEQEKEADRLGHPRWGELTTLKAKHALWRRAHEVRKGKEAPPPFALREGLLSLDADGLNRLAWALVGPDRNEFGREREGLAAARRAAEISSDPLRTKVLNTLAWALFANGLDEPAREAMDQAVLAATKPLRRQNLAADRARLEEEIEAWSKDGGTQLLANMASEVADLEREVARRSRCRFSSEEDRWWWTQVDRLIKEIEAIADPETGLISGHSPEWGWGVGKRLDYLRTLEQRTLLDPGAAWDEARARVATHPEYSGLELSPQLGLVPLGPDPASTLEEFAETATGEPPTRDPNTGKLVLREGMGLVFVLLPAGTFRMGAQASDSRGSNHDPHAIPDEGPPHDVTLSAFFLSKYEMTQGQWERFTGSNPSFSTPGRASADNIATLLYPVEQVSWEDCERVLGRLGLLLPTEAQWEYACRARTTTPWSCREDRLAKTANLFDRFGWSEGADLLSPHEPWDDGYHLQAAVGTFEANRWGLHDMHGNVFEWCRDKFGRYGGARLRAGDGLRDVAGDVGRVNRGAGFGSLAARARSAARKSHPPTSRQATMGLRPSRRIVAP